MDARITKEVLVFKKGIGNMPEKIDGPAASIRAMPSWMADPEKHEVKLHIREQKAASRATDPEKHMEQGGCLYLPSPQPFVLGARENAPSFALVIAFGEFPGMELKIQPWCIVLDCSDDEQAERKMPGINI